MVGRGDAGDSLLSADGGLAEARDVGATALDVRDVGRSAATQALGVAAFLDVSEVHLGGDNGGRGGGEEDGETHTD